MKKSAKFGRHKPPSKIYTVVQAFLGGPFLGKKCGLYTQNPPAEEVGGLEAFLYEVPQNFEL
jgi:hypothetical protein